MKALLITLLVMNALALVARFRSLMRDHPRVVSISYSAGEDAAFFLIDGALVAWILFVLGDLA